MRLQLCIGLSQVTLLVRSTASCCPPAADAAWSGRHPSCRSTTRQHGIWRCDASLMLRSDMHRAACVSWQHCKMSMPGDLSGRMEAGRDACGRSSCPVRSSGACYGACSTLYRHVAHSKLAVYCQAGGRRHYMRGTHGTTPTLSLRSSRHQARSDAAVWPLARARLHHQGRHRVGCLCMQLSVMHLLHGVKQVGHNSGMNVHVRAAVAWS